MIQMPSKARPPLFLPAFERIFRTIHGVLLNEQCDPANACLFFGIIGAAILAKHHDLSAKPVVGAAGYNFGNQTNDVLVFAQLPPCSPASSENAFHCWTEVNGWAIDFQAPLFGERLTNVGVSMPVPRYMLQRSLLGASASMLDLNKSKAYWYELNQPLQTQLLANFYDQPVYVDLLDICVDWYKPHPKQMIKCLGIKNRSGEVQPVQLSPIKLDGAW